jgi:predicted metal-dependent hydrolase
MQLFLPFAARLGRPRPEPARDVLTAGRRVWTVTYVRHRRARHYLLRVEEDGSLRVTIPRGGSRKDAERFAKDKADWIERERYRRELARGRDTRLDDGSPVLLRGEAIPLELDLAAGTARVGGETIALTEDGPTGTSAAVTRHLRALAARELPARLAELAASLGYNVSGVTIRDQRSRWGSCSPAGRISLNWRLVQAPPSVRDYVLMHELTHLADGNHSSRFWKNLEAVCPWHQEARAWLRAWPPRGGSRQ